MMENVHIWRGGDLDWINVLKLQTQADFSLFIEVLDMVKRVNKEMASRWVGGMALWIMVWSNLVHI